MRLVQVNLQTGFGGGEVYTIFLGRALRRLGIEFDLVAHRDAQWWRRDDTGASCVLTVSDPEELPSLPLDHADWLIFHGPDRPQRILRLKEAGRRVAAFVHMPAYQRDVEPYRVFDRLFPVSDYVRRGLVDAGFAQTHDEPLYGVAWLDRPRTEAGPIAAGPLFAWDRRKLRDRVLSWAYPAWRAVAPKPAFTRRSGLGLAVVSRLTPIKQFPQLFSALMPALRAEPRIVLDIFGSGGYASVRDTRRALAPLGRRVRWWGEQRDVARVYSSCDYLLTGLPEKEALGLNVLEAQLCGTPVLAPAAPPFVETVVDGRSGYLYADPRSDGGRGFAELAGQLLDGTRPRPDPRLAEDHLARFSEDAFTARVGRAVAAMIGGRP